MAKINYWLATSRNYTKKLKIKVRSYSKQLNKDGKLPFLKDLTIRKILNNVALSQVKNWEKINIEKETR